MGYSIMLYTLSKKANSTKRPQIEMAQRIELPCDILETNTLNPTVAIVTEDNPVKYNYAHIQAYNRYYFINTWEFDKGRYIATMQVDALASWKTYIGQQTLYILRSAAAWNGRIVDSAYPARVGTTHAIGGPSYSEANPFATRYLNGYFVVGIINGDNTTQGAVSYYVFTAAQFRVLMERLLGDVSFYNITEISEELAKALMNPFQYIVSAMWFPFRPHTGATITSLRIGWWDYNISCARMGETMFDIAGPHITLPKHPDGISRGYFLYSSPYTEYYLYFPPWGNFSLPAEKLVDSTYIITPARVDCVTGLGWLSIYGSDMTFINVVEAQIGVPIQLAQMAPQIANAFSPVVEEVQNTRLPVSAGGLFANIVQSNVTAKITEVASNILSAVISTKMPAQTNGHNGVIEAGRVTPVVYATFAHLTDDDITEKGRPLLQRRRIDTLPGFIQCGETDIDIPCLKAENDIIRQYLLSGFYWE